VCCITLLGEQGKKKKDIRDTLHVEVNLGYGSEHHERVGDAALLAELALNLYRGSRWSKTRKGKTQERKAGINNKVSKS
jgi:hypothetical protein